MKSRRRAHGARKRLVNSAYVQEIILAPGNGGTSFFGTVPARLGATLWQRAREAGAVPLGIEALGVLRAEKGYLYIGQDTDGERGRDLAAESIRPEVVTGMRTMAYAGNAAGSTEVPEREPAAPTAAFEIEDLSVSYDEVRAVRDVTLKIASRQITALIASGALDLAGGVALAVARADCTQAAADATPGRMAALIGADIDTAEKACTDAEAWVANDNAPGQVVIGGTAEGIEAATARAGDLGVRRVIALNVGAAFHTPLMQAAADAFAPTLASTGADGWPKRLADHLILPVQWRSTLETLVEMGSTSFIETGPGNVLAGLAKRTVGAAVTLRSVTVPTDAEDA